MAMRIVLTIAIVLAGCAEQSATTLYYTPQGALTLIESTELGARLDRHSPVLFERNTDTQTEPTLPVYFTESGKGPLIADELIRAQFERSADIGAIAARYDVTIQKIRDNPYIFELLVDDPRAAASVAQRLVENGDALWAHPSFFQPLYVGTGGANDTFIAEQWHLGVIRAPGAWSVTRGSPTTSVAVIDTGLDMTHPDLAAKVTAPFDAHDQDADPTALPDAPHGTACAGLAVAVTNNNTGVAGVCPDCSLMPIRVQGEEGWTRIGALSDAIYWAVDNGARVLSASWTTLMSDDLATAIAFAANESHEGRGAVLLFAAGNDSATIPSDAPASHPDVLAIGATNPFDVHAGYSNTGAVLDLTAPAGSMTTDLQGVSGYAIGDYTDSFDGTSAATPVAAGVAALLLSLEPNLSRSQVETLLLATAKKVDLAAAPYVDGRNDTYGFGRVDATAAVNMLLTGWGNNCESAAECGPAGDCMPSVGGIGGASRCVLSCDADSECPGDFGCRLQADAESACLPTCEINFDCAGGTACWPAGEEDLGHCLTACTFDSDCGDSTCNQYGMCGAIKPPGMEVFEPLVGKMDCAAGGMPSLWLLAALGLRRRRR